MLIKSHPSQPVWIVNTWKIVLSISTVRWWYDINSHFYVDMEHSSRMLVFFILKFLFFQKTKLLFFVDPVVMVERKGDGKNLLISQRRFLLRDRSHYDSTKWELHLNYALSTSRNFENTRPSFVMSRVQESIQLELQEEVDWAIFNVQQTGINEDSGTSGKV